MEKKERHTAHGETEWVEGIGFLPSRRPKKRPVKSKKKLLNIECSRGGL